MKKLKEFLSLSLRGVAMGMADLVPGVSGGTIAYITGIYERLIGAISFFSPSFIYDVILKRKWRLLIDGPDWMMIGAIATGIVTAIIFFTKIISLPELLDSHTEMVYGLFFGLVAASVVLLLGAEVPFRMLSAIWIFIGFILALLVVSLVPVETPKESWFLFISGMVAISAMLLPGLSGSFILLILGQYKYIITAVADFDLSVLLPFLIGIISGLMLFSKFLSWLLGKYRFQAILFINGILLGSLWRLWPWQNVKDLSYYPYIPDSGSEFVAVALCMFTGAFIVLLLNRISRY